MRKLLIGLLAIFMVAGASVPTASAYHAWWHWPPFTPEYSPPPPPPPPSCYTEPGYWMQVPYTDGFGYTQYRSVWVPSRTVCSRKGVGHSWGIGLPGATGRSDRSPRPGPTAVG
jgi:hypothetical protein